MKTPMRLLSFVNSETYCLRRIVSVRRRWKRKRRVITGYALGVLAFLMSREPVQSVEVTSWPPRLVKLAGVLAASAIVTTALSLVVRNHRWLSDDQWFQNADALLNDAEMLRRSHVLAIHAANRALTDSNDRKAQLVMVGQRALVLAGVCWLVCR